MSFLQERSFQRRPGLPSVTTGAISSIGSTSATASGIVNALSDLTSVTTNFSFGTRITQQGFVYSTSPNPTLLTGTIVVDAGLGGSFSDSLTGLSPSTTYFVDAYATNITGAAYGGDVSFSTSSSGAVLSNSTLLLMGVG